MRMSDGVNKATTYLLTLEAGLLNVGIIAQDKSVQTVLSQDSAGQ